MNTLTKAMILGMLAVVCLGVCVMSDDSDAATATPTYTDGDWGYDLITSNGVTTAKIVSYSGAGGGAITIPTTIGGYTVTELGKDANSGNNNVFESSLTATDLIIPDGITRINQNACANLSNFTGTLSIGHTVDTLRSGCFANCGFTGALTVPSSITTMYGGTGVTGTFQNCTGFTSLTLENGMSGNLANKMFMGCTGITGPVVIPDGVRSIRTETFRECTGITSVVFGSGITFIDDRAFYGCTGLTGTLTIPDNITSLSQGSYNDVRTFYGCTGLDSVIIGNGLTKIPRECFSNCSGLTSITFGNSLIEIGGGSDYGASPFYGCINLAGPLTLPNTLVTIGAYAFYQLSGLTGPLIIPNNVTTIGGHAFHGCTGFTSLTIGTSVSEIKPGVFSQCTGLTGDLVIPDSVTTIYSSYYYSSSSQSTKEANPFYNCGFDGSLILGDGLTSVTTYSFGEVHFQDDLVIGDSITSISKLDCCATCTGTLTIGNGVTSIDYNAFKSFLFTGSLNLPNGLLIIGKGAFYNCKGFTGSLVIPSTVTTIGQHSTSNTSNSDGVFYGCTGFTGNLVIPDSVTLIGDYAFSGCTGLTGTLTLGSGATALNPYCFSNCRFTGNLTIPSNFTHIQGYAFQSNTGFTSLTLNEGLVSIWYGAFKRCTGLTGQLVIPNSVTTLGSTAYNYGVFQECTGLTSVVLGNHIQTIGSSCFQGCTSLSGNLAIPDSVTYIGIKAFYQCAFNGTLTIGNHVQTIEYGAFNYAGSFVGDLIIPDSVTTFGKSDSQGYNQEPVFQSSGFTGSLTIGNGITIIPQGTFYGCGFTGTLTLGSNVTQIGSYDSSSLGTFAGIPFTGPLVIPNSVITIKSEAFRNCTGFTSLTFGSGIQNIGFRVFSGCTGFTGNLTIPSSVISIGRNYYDTNYAYDSYSFADCTGFTSLTIENGLVYIGRGAFSGCTGFRGDLVIPDSVTRLEAGFGVSYETQAPFYNCGFDGSLIIGNGLTGGISEYQFKGCNFQDDCVIGDSITSISVSGLECCRQCTGTLTLGSGLTSIGRQAFYNFHFTGPLVLPDGLEIIQYGAFYGCSGFTGALVIPGSVTTIGNDDTSNNYGAFYGCSGFTSLTIEDGVEFIGRNTFSGCIGLTGNLVIPDSVTFIGTHSFYNCKNISSLKISNEITSIPTYAFYNCIGLTGTLIIPDGVTTIGTRAFYYYDTDVGGLNTVVLGKGLTSIGESAFAGYTYPVKKLSNIVAYSDPTLGDNVFNRTSVSQILNLTDSNLTNIVPGNRGISSDAVIRTDFEDTAMLQRMDETIIVDKEGTEYDLMRVIPIFMALAILVGIAYYIRGNKT